MESTSAVVDSEGHGRLEYAFEGGTGSGKEGGGGGDDGGGVSVHCNSEGCTIDFADLDYVAAGNNAAVVITDGDEMIRGSIFECTLTGDEDGGFECMAVTETTDDPISSSENRHATTNQDPPPDPHQDQDSNLVVTSSSFDAGTVTNINSIRMTTPQRMVAE